MPPNPTRLRRTAIIGTALIVVLSVAGYEVYHAFQRVAPAFSAPPGCRAGAGAQSVGLETGQAEIAATIAGVAARHRLPRRAVTIAYATALQESQLHNLDYGDRDSVGVFQQRPSQGWGTATELEDPVYATTRFFDALVKVHGYTKMPVEVAAQAVQHSADGAAYQQFEPVATLLTQYFTGKSPRGVYCWYFPGTKADLAGAMRGMKATFGPLGKKNGVLAAVTTGRSAPKNGRRVAVVHARQTSAWTVAGWLVAHAQQYGISQVRYAGYEWKAADGSMGWQRDAATKNPKTAKTPAPGSIVAG